ncbi:MAG: hypothetical protein PHD95_01195 [Candidatus ainarchaeum sp.]|nr:hypothetical protein [Candidatus ainarchaeum sp.]
MKGSFLIKAKKESIITDKGVRAFVMDHLLNSPFQKASVTNIDKKTVEVKLEGDEKQIKEFIQNLQKALVVEFGNPTISFTPFEENPVLEIPELMRASQALMVGQLHKGVNVQLEILGALKQMSLELRGMSKGLKEMLGEIGKVLGRQQ